MTNLLGPARGAAARLLVHLHGGSVGEDLDVRGRIFIRGRGRVILGNRVVLDASRVPIELHAVDVDSEIVIGDDVHIEGGTSIEAQRRVQVGARCHIASFAKLMDNHFHEASGDRSRKPRSVPLVLEDDVQIGTRAILLPGAYAERGVVLQPGAVLTKRVRRGSIVSGVPGRVVGTATPRENG